MVPHFYTGLRYDKDSQLPRWGCIELSVMANEAKRKFNQENTLSIPPSFSFPCLPPSCSTSLNQPVEWCFFFFYQSVTVSGIQSSQSCQNSLLSLLLSAGVSERRGSGLLHLVHQPAHKVSVPRVLDYAPSTSSSKPWVLHSDHSDHTNLSPCFRSSFSSPVYFSSCLSSTSPSHHHQCLGSNGRYPCSLWSKIPSIL